MTCPRCQAESREGHDPVESMDMRFWLQKAEMETADLG